MLALTFTLPTAGERIDRALAAAYPDLSRAQWQRLIKEGQVQIAGIPVKSSYRVSSGDVVQATIPAAVPTALQPESIPLDIRYEDDDLIVINKPAGMVVHPGSGHETGTLVHAVLAHCPDLPGIGGEIRPGVIHRLDKDTSGLVIMAKNEKALRYVQGQFKGRTIEKTYLALVEGTLQPPRAIIDAPIGRDPHNRQRMAVIVGEQGRKRDARTQFETVTAFAAYTLAACKPITGRTHQIRVHMAYIGHPIVGDRIYGRRKPSLPILRHFLHAYRLVFNRPSDKSQIMLVAELPAELQTILDQLLKYSDFPKSPK